MTKFFFGVALFLVAFLAVVFFVVLVFVFVVVAISLYCYKLAAPLICLKSSHKTLKNETSWTEQLT